MLRLRAWHLACALLLGSCSKSYDVVITVTVAEGVELPDGASIAFSVLEWDREEFDKEWADELAPIVQGQREYKKTVGVCCAPDPTVRVYAFVDLDGDRKHDPEERWGQDPNTPNRLDDPVYESTVSIR